MSLVDKLEGVHVGDLILLSGASSWDVVGFVASYSTHSVFLSNSALRKNNGSFRNVKPFYKNPLLSESKVKKERLATIPLDWFDTYEILRKYTPPKDDQLSNK